VLPVDGADALRTALAPLIEHRRREAGPLLQVLDVRPGESVRRWLGRHHIGPGDVDPEVVPYYLTLVGDVDAIPFEFQVGLAAGYCVGRLPFAGPDELATYAADLVRREQGPPRRRREVVYWAPRHDPATELSCTALALPLHRGHAEARGVTRRPPTAGIAATSRAYLAAEATRARLHELLHGGDERPALLFTASHGLGFPPDHPAQASDQGALLCQDWPGRGPPDPAREYFAARDVADEADVDGLVAFLFACHGAGTPAFDEFSRDPGQEPTRIAPAPFLAALPRRLLAHPRGAALAVVGHVERAWGCSITPTGAGTQLLPFHNFVKRVLAGEPIGLALRDFADRAAVYAAQLLGLLRRPGARPEALVQLWMERNDALNYVLLGDPAARTTTAAIPAA
jgi:hypothetical protein